MAVLIDILGVLGILLVVGSIVGVWWLLARVLNSGTAEAGGSFGDQLLGERNTRKNRKPSKGDKSAG